MFKHLMISALFCGMLLPGITVFAAPMPMADHAMPCKQMLTSDQMQAMSKDAMMAACKDQMMTMMHKKMMQEMMMMHKNMSHQMMMMMTMEQATAITDSLKSDDTLRLKMLGLGTKNPALAVDKEQWMAGMHMLMMELNPDQKMLLKEKMMASMTKDQMMKMYNMHTMMMAKMCMDM